MNSPHASQQLLAGTLAILLRHYLTGCPATSLQAAGLLERLADTPDLDRDLRDSCEQLSSYLYLQSQGVSA